MFDTGLKMFRSTELIIKLGHLLSLACILASFFTAHGYVLEEWKDTSIAQIYSPKFVDEFKSKIVRPRYDVDCQDMLENNDTQVKRVRSMLENMRAHDGRVPVLEDENFIFPPDMCDLYKEIRLSKRPFYNQMLKSQTHPIADQTSLSYSIVLHDAVEQFERFLMTVYNPNNIYCIHVDNKSNPTIQKAVKSIADCFDNVFLTTKQEDVFWGGISLLKAELNCMSDLLNLDNLIDKHPNLMGKRSVPWKYHLNLLAADFQMRTNGELLEILDFYNGSSLVETTPNFGDWDVRITYKHMENHEINRVMSTNEKYTPPPHGFELAQGYLEAVMHRDFVKYALTDQRARDLLDWSAGIYIPDEMFFPTLLYNTQFYNQSGYQRVKDPIAYDTIVRFTAWQTWPGNFRYDCKGGLWRHSLCVFSVEDLEYLTQERKELVVHKFLLSHDPVAYQCLEEWFYSREGRVLSTEEAEFYCHFAQRHFPHIKCPTPDS